MKHLKQIDWHWEYLLGPALFIVAMLTLQSNPGVKAASGIQDWQIAWGLNTYEVNADDNPTDTTSFNNNLSAADDTVQKAFDTLDDISSSGAPVDASYVVMGLNGTLTDERVMTAGDGLSLTDGGAAGNATLDADGKLLQSATDTTRGYLTDKTLSGEGIDLATGNPGGDEHLLISCEDATETNKGILEIATDAEAAAGTATDKALVPSNISSFPFDAIPAGVMMEYGGTSLPSGWLTCDGTAVSRVGFADLFAAIGTAFGIGDGVTTFNLPDYRGRVAIGLDNLGGTPANRITDAAADAIGGSGGSETHTLTTAEMPSHTHAITPQALAVGGAANTDPGPGFTYDKQTLTAAPTGSGNAHANTQPWLAVSKIIKT